MKFGLKETWIIVQEEIVASIVIWASSDATKTREGGVTLRSDIDVIDGR